MTIAIEKSFQLMYSNTHLKSRETVPLREQISVVDAITNQGQISEEQAGIQLKIISLQLIRTKQ